ncbi:MAG: hypothetical protein JXA89_27010 [Anaerolineae bacterium]|nr:hypothetical protein [Anaerolineae bacterium]
MLGVMIVVAAFLRFAWLDTVPPGMTHDEAAFGAEAEIILNGEWPIYFTLGYGHEPFYSYFVAAAFVLFGHTVTVMRATAAAFGLVLVPLTYLFARLVFSNRHPFGDQGGIDGPQNRMFGFHIAWISAAWMAVSFWPISICRQALRGNTLASVWLLAAMFFWKALQTVQRNTLQMAHRKMRQVTDLNPQSAGSGRRQPTFSRLWQSSVTHFTIAGFLLGLSFYTYLPARVTWAVFPAMACYMLLFKETRSLLRCIWPGMVLMVAVAALVALPLGWYLVAHPSDQVRFAGMMGPINEFLQGKPQRLFNHLWNGVRVFSWVGDTFWVYNIPGRPIFNWAGSILFYVGLILAIWRWRDARYAFLLLWLPAAMFSGLVTTNEGIFWRTLAAQPVVYLFLAFAVVEIWAFAMRRLERPRAAPRGLPNPRSGSGDSGRTGVDLPRLDIADGDRGASFGIRRSWVQVAWIILAVALVLMEGWRSSYTYFVDWPDRPETRNIHNQNMVAVSKYLRDEPEDGAVAFSAMYPLYYHDPWIFRYVAVRHDIADRWFNGLGGIVYPVEGKARFVFSALTPLDPALQAEFEASAKLIERRELEPDDENPFFEVWRWDGGQVLQARVETLAQDSPMWVSPEIQFTHPELRRLLDDGAQFGDLLTLTGYRLNGERFKVGDVVELVTYWRALRTVQAQDDWDTFVHLLDQDSQVIGGTDVLDSPPTGWRPGDTVVQVHRFHVGEASPQAAWIEIGVYRHKAGRLPVMLDGEAAGDRVLLVPVSIE